MADRHSHTRPRLPVPTELRLDVWTAWRHACLETWSAYRDWCAAPSKQKRSAFTRYRAAAEREDAASTMLQRGLAGTPLIPPHLDAAESLGPLGR